jgi:hypothetical protein
MEPPEERAVRTTVTPPPALEKRFSGRLAVLLAAAAVLAVVVIVVVLVVGSGGKGDPQKAIDMVQDYLQEKGIDPEAFKNWEASGREEDMEVSAIFDISSLGDEYRGLPGGYYNQKYTWKVNLKTGEVHPGPMGL